MSEQEYKSRLNVLKPFITLFIVVMGTAFLASCGGGSGETTQTIQANNETSDDTTKQALGVSGGTVPVVWKGRAPLPNLKAPNEHKVVNTELGPAAAEIILAGYKPHNELAVFDVLKANNLQIIARTGDFVQIRFPGATQDKLKEMISVLKKSNLFIYVGYDRIRSNGSFTRPDPPLSDDVKYWNYYSIKSKQAWALLDAERSTSSVRIGISDQGFSVYNVDDTELMAIYGKNMDFYCDAFFTTEQCKDSDNHGYHVSGIVGAQGNNGKGIVGIGSGSANLTTLYAANANSSGLHILGFQELMDRNVRAINFSMWNDTISDSTSVVDAALLKMATDAALDDAELYGANIESYFERRLARGLPRPDSVIVQIAGNAGKAVLPNGTKANSELAGVYNSYLIHAKASSQYRYFSDRLLIVGAFDNNRELADFSQVPISEEGLERFILAPGVNIFSTVRGGLIKMSGTSQAAPHVTGVVALIFQANDKLSAQEARDIILATADTNLGTPFKDRTPGDGSKDYRYLNAEAAVKEAIRRKSSCSAPVRSIAFTENFATALDPARWAVTESGGSVRSGGGSVTLSTVGSKSQFPSIATTTDVIPATGNYSLFCRAKYTNTGPYGAGACVATRNLVDAAANANYGGYIGVWGGGPSVYSWGFDSNNSRLYFAEVAAGTNETHDYETCVIDGEVTAYIDGKLVARVAIAPESLRPRRIWLGHPGSAAAPNTWVTVETSKIEVRQLQTGGTGSVTVLANTIPGATMTVPAGASSCSFATTGNWSAGPNAPLQYQNADGVVGGNSLNLTNFGVPMAAEPNMALVVRRSSTNQFALLGSSKTISVSPGETLSFMMNDSTIPLADYTANTGQLATRWACQ